MAEESGRASLSTFRTAPVLSSNGRHNTRRDCLNEWEVRADNGEKLVSVYTGKQAYASVVSIEKLSQHATNLASRVC